MILGPDGKKERVLSCPGCRRWQLHYSLASVQDLIRWRMEAGRPVSDVSQVDALVEHILARHVRDECPRPDVVQALWKQAGRPS